MSGFVGLLAAAGDAVDPQLLHRLTDGLTYFAPDGASARTSGRIGLGFAELRPTRRPPAHDAASVAMPATDDHGTWVAGDAALDDREQLVRALGARGLRVHADAPEAHLLLAAYRCWGTRCVEHLHGDFAFAIWDGARSRLLLARDRFGTRPLYYAWAGRTFVFSNALDVLRLHPGVPTDLDDAALGDFLRMGWNTDLSTTVFAAVRCVPPAHVLALDEGALRVSRYWDLPVGREQPPAGIDEYAERFAFVFHKSVADRMRGAGDVALFMSGGRDSTAVAAMARAAQHEAGAALHAVTAVFDYALPDAERTYASMAASALGIPVEFVPQDEYAPFEQQEGRDLWRPEPLDGTFLAAESDLVARAAARARVALTGEGGDAVLRERESHLARLLLAGRWGRALAEAAGYVGLHRRLPRPGFRRLRARARGHVSPFPPLPRWLRREWIERTGLHERWERFVAAELQLPAVEVLRPEAYLKLRSGFWTRCFEGDHPGATGIPLMMRHPFFDERVVELLLSLPSVQWANDKGILVAAMRGRLPDRVRLRPKTPLAGDPCAVAFAPQRRARPEPADFCDEALRIIDPAALYDLPPGAGPDDAWDWTRAYSLSRWLERRAAGRRVAQLSS